MGGKKISKIEAQQHMHQEEVQYKDRHDAFSGREWSYSLLGLGRVDLK